MLRCSSRSSTSTRLLLPHKAGQHGRLPLLLLLAFAILVCLAGPLGSTLAAPGTSFLPRSILLSGEGGNDARHEATDHMALNNV